MNFADWIKTLKSNRTAKTLHQQLVLLKRQQQLNTIASEPEKFINLTTIYSKQNHYAQYAVLAHV